MPQADDGHSLRELHRLLTLLPLSPETSPRSRMMNRLYPLSGTTSRLVSSFLKQRSLRRHRLGRRVMRRPNPIAGRLPRHDAIDDLEERQALASITSVFTARPEIVRPLIVRLNMRFALCVFADRHAADAVIAQRHLDAGNAFDGFEHRVHGAVAETGLAVDGAVLIPQADDGRRDRRRAGVASDRLQRPDRRPRFADAAVNCASASTSMSAS